MQDHALQGTLTQCRRRSPNVAVNSHSPMELGPPTARKSHPNFFAHCKRNTKMKKDLHRIHQDLHKIVIKGPAGAGADLRRSFMIQEPSKSLSQEISYKHLCKDLSQDVVRIFTTSSRKDVHKTLVKIFTDHGPLRQTGTTVFCEPAQSKCTWTYQKGPFQQDFFSMEMPQTMTAPPILCEPARSKCTRRSHKELLCENLQ